MKKKNRKLKRKKNLNLQTEERPYLLESDNLADMKEKKKNNNNLLEYQWLFFSELEYQRNQSYNTIQEALILSCTKNFPFKNWQRTVKWKYGRKPLSTVGSNNFSGQRFNMGKDINRSINSFPALYLAKDKDTSLQEVFGKTQSNTNINNLSSQQLALTKPDSEVTISVSGQLDTIIDIRNSKTLSKFVEVIKTFKISQRIKILAKKLKQPTPKIGKTNKQLWNSLLEKNWSYFPTQFDIPSDSQIFGKLVCSVGIVGIIYPSIYTKKPCLAIFPCNFDNTDSYIELDDETPDKKMTKKFDSNNWTLLEK